MLFCSYFSQQFTKMCFIMYLTSQITRQQQERKKIQHTGYTNSLIKILSFVEIFFGLTICSSFFSSSSSLFSKNRPLGRFFHRVRMSVYMFFCIFFLPTNRPTNRQTNRQTTRILELLRAAK